MRVKVQFVISKPLRRSKIMNLPGGETVTIFYDYERIQKRCYMYQRLTHEKEMCPLFQRKLQEAKGLPHSKSKEEVHAPSPVLSKDDHLFGVLSENQVGMDLAT